MRALLNPALEHHVRAQLPAVAAAQRAGNALDERAPPLGRLLRALVALSAATVTVEFYIAALPLLVWSGGAASLAGLKLVGLLATSGYAAYALKDLLASPRPAAEAARTLLEARARAGDCRAGAGAAGADAAAAAVGAAAASALPSPSPPGKRRSSRLAAMHAEMEEQEEQEGQTGGGAGRRASSSLPLPPPAVLAAARALRVQDHSKDVEDGAPSSHVSLSLPMTLHALALLWPVVFAAVSPSSSSAPAVPASSSSAPPPVLPALAWVAFVGWSRLYLGVHTPVDLFLGAALGHLSLAAWRGPVEDAWLGWAMTTTETGWGGGGGAGGPFSSSSSSSFSSLSVPLAAAAAALLAMRMHPVPTRPTACFNYSTAFVGAGLGATLGAWAFAPRLLRVFSGEQAAAAGGGGGALGPLLLFCAFLLKAAVGLAAVLGSRAAVKAALLAALPPVMDAAPWPLRALWQPPPADAALAVGGGGGRRRGGGGGAKTRAPPPTPALPPCRPDNGVPYDVDAAARLGSYTAAVFVVVAHAALWPSVVAAARWWGGWRGGRSVFF